MARVESLFDGRRTLGIALGATALGAAGLVVGAITEPRRTAFAYLTAFAFVVSIELGVLVFLMIGYVMKAKWPVVLRRLTETIAMGLPLCALLFLPIALAAPELYPWANLEAVQGELAHLLHHKRAYLNLPFFFGRTAFYFLLWSALAFALFRLSVRADRNPAQTDTPLPRALSAAGLPAIGLTLTFAAFDWLMSLTPAWFSTAYGLYYYAGGFLGALALLTILTCAAERTGPLAGLVAGDHYYALGRLLLGFTIFWAYIAFFQVFLIYIANKPEEVTFYVTRVTGSWQVIGYVLIFGHFALPFFILLSRALKFRPVALSIVATWLLAMHYVDVYWLVLPAATPSGVAPHWVDAAALVAIGGAALLFATLLLRGRALAPHRDPVFALSLRYRSP